MAEFLTTIATSYCIEEIMMESKNELVLISPYLKLTQIFLERLKDASKRDVRITIIYGKEDLKTKEKNALKELDNLQLYFSKNLHAKCYCNENEMVITSMNMYEFSEKNNREMGVQINKRKDRAAYLKAIAETESILNSAKLIFQSPNIIEVEKKAREEQLKKEEERQRKIEERKELQRRREEERLKRQQERKEVNNTERGFCIRCNSKMKLDPVRPLCDNCYSTWSQFSNIDYEENYCHSCGKSHDGSYARPLCYSCFKSLPSEVKLELTKSRY